MRHKRQRVICTTCGVPFVAYMRRAHERGAWHQNFAVISSALKAEMSIAQIGRLIDAPASQISYYLRITRNGRRRYEGAPVA